MRSTAAQDYSFSVGSSFWDNKVGARFYARDYDYDGEYKNTLTNQLVGDESTESAGLYLTWNPIEDLKFATNLFYRQDDDGPLALFLQPATKNNCKPGYRSTFYRDSNPSPTVVTRGSDPNQYFCGKIEPGVVALNTDPIAATGGRDGTAFDGVESDEYFGMLRADWDIGGSGWTATSLSGYRSFDNKFGTDSDHSGAFVLAPSYNPNGTPPGLPDPGHRHSAGEGAAVRQHEPRRHPQQVHRAAHREPAGQAAARPDRLLLVRLQRPAAGTSRSPTRTTATRTTSRRSRTRPCSA